MQTFLPYKSFKKSAEVLDYRRLGKQRIEGMQILNVLADFDNAKGWKYHPAVLMWKGYEIVLIQYVITMCVEWTGRGYNDTIADRVSKMNSTFFNTSSFSNPPWLGGYKFHRSHKSNLLRKDNEFYSRYKWNVSDDLPYIWPVAKEDLGL